MSLMRLGESGMGLQESGISVCQHPRCGKHYTHEPFTAYVGQELKGFCSPTCRMLVKMPDVEREKEICICAAIRLDDGRIIRGHRHDDCIQTALKWRSAGQDIGELRMEGQQGFMTSRNRFVERKEAYQLQVAAGLFKDRPGVQILMSEDLY